MLVCKRVIYAGRVQGVGFRVTAYHLARGFEVSGTVRNLPDGTVELVAEGAPDQVGAFLGALRRDMSGYVEDETSTDCPPGNRHGFTIRH
jgi:acylphosphatase